MDGGRGSNSLNSGYSWSMFEEKAREHGMFRGGTWGLFVYVLFKIYSYFSYLSPLTEADAFGRTNYLIIFVYIIWAYCMVLRAIFDVNL